MTPRTKANLLIWGLILIAWGVRFEQEAAFAAHTTMWSQDLAFFHQILFTPAKETRGPPRFS